MIEYHEFPPPNCLVKAMTREWAFELVNNGVLRIHHIGYLRSWENKILGDRYDGKGMYRLHGQPMDIGSSNDVYIWCGSFPNISSQRINLIAEHGIYDCMVVIHNPNEIFERIHSALSVNCPGFSVLCGKVKYDRGSEVDKAALNRQKFHFNVFQKSPVFYEDCEYRLSITNSTFVRLNEKYIDLCLGNCSDFISIEALPLKALTTDCLGQPIDGAAWSGFQVSD